MAYVIDASVAVKWFVTEENTDEALALLASGAALFTPAFMFLEVSNVLRKKCTAGMIAAADARERLAELPRYFHGIDRQSNFVKAFDLSSQINHPVYDCVYLLAALDYRMPLVTADKVLARKANSVAHLVVHELSSCDLSSRKVDA